MGSRNPPRSQVWALTSGSGEPHQRFAPNSSPAQSINTNSTVFICYCTSSQETGREHLRREWCPTLGRNKHTAHPWYHLHSHVGWGQWIAHQPDTWARRTFQDKCTRSKPVGHQAASGNKQVNSDSTTIQTLTFSTFVVVCWWELLAMIIMSQLGFLVEQSAKVAKEMLIFYLLRL